MATAEATTEAKPKVTYLEGQPTKEQREPAKVTEEVLVEQRKRVSGTGTVTRVVLIPAKEGEELAPFRAKCEHGKSDRKRHKSFGLALASAKASQEWCQGCRAAYDPKHCARSVRSASRRWSEPWRRYRSGAPRWISRRPSAGWRMC